jgi:hypothetical protein
MCSHLLSDFEVNLLRGFCNMRESKKQNSLRAEINVRSERDAVAEVSLADVFVQLLCLLSPSE